jgi:O-antigen/teichoic acid export membrane protein
MKALTESVRWVWRAHSGTAATVQTILTRVFILAINMATGIITARTLGPEGRGEQAAMILWPQFLAYAMTLGMPVALLYNFKRYPEEESELFSAALLLGTGLGIVATFTGVIFIPVWLSQYSMEVIRTAQAFMIFAPMSLLSVIFTGALEARHNFTVSNQVRYLPPLITLTILAGFALAHGLTPFTAGLAYILPALPIFSWMLVRLWKRYHPRWRGLGKSYQRLIGYGLRSYGIDLLSTLASQVDQALVIGLLTPASMGMYVVALSLSRMLNLFQSAIVTVLLPKAVARPVEEVVDLTGRAARTSMALTLLVAMTVMLLGPVLLRLLYGSEFMGAVPVFRILVIEVVIGGTTWVLAQAFMALGRPGTVSILQGIGLGLSVPLMLLLIPTYGLVGAGLALLGSTTARLIFVLVSYPLFLKVRPPGLIITRKDWYFMQQIFESKQS